ncbi:helix-turn-helix domain-containing protein [Aliiglaciecola sp. 3_MG-2023]|uniref:winged helix-turn-helix transcriptional regulator n=1 Tax=Aliiglaciecola sp. 3_MG-2023 TaxID=3062644 RepID=UPI0026E220A9|nr:helix-turn-helix domain-containing protein [Aliiglaciecola sp. 3_MG-2023]MDO6694489.1 helix-turn-helix domain-containing protein [Aliiglaciecola sp. 3_MG-2023]
MTIDKEPTHLNSPSTDVKLIQTCSIWRALEIIGDSPVLLIMESYWLGARRFDEFCQQTKLLKPVVSNRLKRLIDKGCMVKVAYSERPKRYEYKATEKFIDLYPVALAMLHWERQWGQKSGKLEIVLTHKSCGNITDPFPACESCGTEISPLDVSWETGPGAGEMEAKYSARRRKTSKSASSTTLLDDSIQIIGDRWGMLIFRSLFSGVNQFQGILKATYIATNILSNRLSELCEDGFLTTTEVAGDSRRIQYKLTKKGISIYPIILTLMQWGDKWLPSPEGPPLLLTHTICGDPLKLEMICSCCKKEVYPTDTSYALQISNSRGKLSK